MKTLARLLTPLTLVAVLAGCADDDPRDVTEPGAGNATSESVANPTGGGTESPETTPTSSGRQAVSVAFRVEGGLRPTDETQVFAADDMPPPGHSAADVQRVLELASDPALIDLEPTKMPADTCCDRQTYQVTVTYADGTSRIYLSLDGSQQPQPLTELLSAMS